MVSGRGDMHGWSRRGLALMAISALCALSGGHGVAAREATGNGREEVLAPSGRAIDVRQVLDASIDDVFRTVTDYERYVDMIPDIFSAEVVRRDDSVVDVRFKYHLVMAGDLGITRRFVQRDHARVDFSTLDGDLGELSGSWTFKPAADPGKTEVAYQATLKPRFDAPGFLVRYVLRSEAPRILDRIERLANTEPKG
jgi:ribosome-associated toxin RatA of RatAB toxin-antitoxin module